MAGGPGGKEVGRVSIKIAPDSSDFIGEVRRLVREAEGQKVTIGVELDAGAVRAELKALTSSLGNEKVSLNVDADTAGAVGEARVATAEIGKLNPKVKVELDRSGLEAQRAAVVAMIDELKAKKVDPKIDLDIADAKAKRDEIAAKLEELRTKEVTPKVTADIGKAERNIARIDIHLDELNAKKVSPKVDAQIAAAQAKLLKLDAQLDAIGRKDVTTTVHVKVDDAGLGGIGDGKSGVFSGIANALGNIPSLAAAASGAMGTFAQAAIGGLGSTILQATSLSQAFGSIIPVIGQAVSAFLSFGLLAGVYTVVAGAIVAALGAISSAMSALPALAIGGGAAIGVLAIAFSNFGDALGRGKTGEALKKQNEALAKLPPPAREAAQAINGPLLTAFDALRNAIQFSFFQGFAAQIQDLAARVMPALTLSLQGVASSLGAMVLGLASVAFSSAGIANLNTAFQGMSQLLTIITPSLQGLVQVLLQAAGTSAVWQVLGEIISVVIGLVTQLFAQFTAGGGASLMVESLTQLRDVIAAAGGAFVTLAVQVANFFTGAGPGLRDLFDAINRTLQEIDFRGLGVSFGIFASAVGRFIDNVPPSVWQGIADAVRDMALKFQELSNDPAMQQLFTSLIGAIPIVIGMFTTLLGVVQTFAGFLRGMESAILGFLETIGLVAPGTQAAFDGATGAAAGAVGPMGAAAGGVGRAAQQGVLDNMQGISPEVRAALQRGIDAANGQAPPMGAAGESVGTAAVRGATAGMAPLPPEVLAAAARGVDNVRGQAGPMQGAGNNLGASGDRGARAGMAPMPAAMLATANRAKDGVGSTAPGFGAVGGQIARALANAIANGASLVIGAAIGIARAALNAAKNALGIASPSRVFRDEVGQWIPEGIALGITDHGVAVTAAIAQMLALANGAGVRAQSIELGRTIGDQVGTGVQAGVVDAFNALPDVVKLGTVSNQLWDKLTAAGWRGRAGDGMEALYRPNEVAPSPAYGANATGPAGGAGGADVISALQGLTWSVELDPEGLARIQARGSALRTRR